MANSSNAEKFRASIRVFTAEVNRQLFDANGGVSTLLRDAAGQLKQAASEDVGQRTGNRYSGQHPGRRLRNSGKVERSENPGEWRVVFEHRAALVHHVGAKPHQIPKGGASYLLINRNPIAGKDGRFAAIGPVDHKGHAPNPYLTTAARSIGFRVTDARSPSRSARVSRGFL